MSKTIPGAFLAAATIFASVSVDLVGGQALAAVVSVTESQVRNVCGSALQSNGGAIGCRKGATDYNCYEGKCQAISRVGASPSTQGVDRGVAEDPDSGTDAEPRIHWHDGDAERGHSRRSAAGQISTTLRPAEIRAEISTRRN